MDLLIFDIDGTLTDTAALHQACFLEAFEQFQIPHINTNWAGYTHHTDSWIFAEVFRNGLKREASEDERKDFERAVVKNFMDLTAEQPITEIPGASAFVHQQQENPHRAYVFATGAFRETAEEKLRSLNIAYPPELLVTASEFETREEIVGEAIARAGTHYSRTSFARSISVGDGYWDLKTAERLAVEFIGIAEEQGAQALQEAGAARVFPDFLNFTLD